MDLINKLSSQITQMSINDQPITMQVMLIGLSAANFLLRMLKKYFLYMTITCAFVVTAKANCNLLDGEERAGCFAQFVFLVSRDG